MSEPSVEIREPKILLWDIETSHNVVAVFQLNNNDWIQPENILQERFVICASWKELGVPGVRSVSLLDDSSRFQADPTDDYYVMATLHEVLSDADVLIAHNGDSFDLKYVKTRMAIHGLPPLPPITTIDTLTVAKRNFMFNSNKLDYIGKMLGCGRKKSTGGGLWLRVLKGDDKAVKDMVAYNKHDVILLEKVFLKLRPYCANHVNRELFGKTGCPRCGSAKIQSRGFHRAISRVYRRFQCQECSGWFKSAANEKGVTTRVRTL